MQWQKQWIPKCNRCSSSAPARSPPPHPTKFFCPRIQPSWSRNGSASVSRFSPAARPQPRCGSHKQCSDGRNMRPSRSCGTNVRTMMHRQSGGLPTMRGMTRIKIGATQRATRGQENWRTGELLHSNRLYQSNDGRLLFCIRGSTVSNLDKSLRLKILKINSNDN